jgi:hypothetical protein
MQLQILLLRLSHISFVVGLVALGEPIAGAQTVGSAAAAKLEFLNDRLDAMLATGPNGLVTGNFYVPQRSYANTEAATAGAPPDGVPQFSFNILSPGNWDSNANTLPSGGSSALQVAPDLHLGATDHFATMGGITLSGSGDLVLNRYSNDAGKDASPVSYSFEIQRVSGQNDQEFQPFLAYSSQTAYSSTFSADSGTVRKVSAGSDKLWEWGYWERGKGLERDPQDQPIANRFVTLQVGLSAQAGRAFATSSPSSTFLKVSPSFGYNSNNGLDSDAYASHWSTSLAVNITRIWQDAGSAAAGAMPSGAEQDWTIGPVLTVLYSPPARWFRWANNQSDAQEARNATSIGGPVFTLQVAYSRFTSNLPGKSYDGWTIGPSLGVSWKF